MRKKINNFLIELGFSAVALLISFLVGAIIILVIKQNPIYVFSYLLNGAFGSLDNIADTLEYATPLIFTGLAVAFAFRAGLFNIGAEGQLYVGAFAVAIAGYFIRLPKTPHILIVIVVAAIAGALWALIPAILKSELGVHEVITTIMMNYIALSLTNYLTNLKIFKLPGQIPQTYDILPSARFASITALSEYTKLNTGIFLGILCAIIVYVIIVRTKMGYEIRAVGYNINAAHYGGINYKKKMLIAMLISGALAGLAGAEQVAGVHYHFVSPFPAGLGFLGIAVALLGRNDPIGVVLAAFLFGALSAGGTEVDTMTMVPREVIDIIQAIIILFVTGEVFLRRAIIKKIKSARYKKMLALQEATND